MDSSPTSCPIRAEMALRICSWIPPLACAYSYFRRTGKMSHEDLRRMDPAFIAAYEASHGTT